MTPIHLSKAVQTRAQCLGFTPPHILSLNDFGADAGHRLKDFIAREYHGTMTWLAETQVRRGHPKSLWPEARSAVVFGMNYGPEHDPLEMLEKKNQAAISVYAQRRDYHGVIKGRLKEVAGLIARDTAQDVKVFVDTAPLMEKPIAQAAGLGWQGKHTNLVSQHYGSWLFLGVILSAADLSPTPPETDHCGSCRACLDICPTQAFPAPYQLDARRCISYLTIEHKGPVDIELREKMGNRVFGCDDCLAVCPWNKFAKIGSDIKLSLNSDLDGPELSGLAALDETQFRTKFSGTPIKRIGHAQFLRNVLYAIGNSGQQALRESAARYLEDSDPTIKDAAQWACARLDRSPA